MCGDGSVYYVCVDNGGFFDFYVIFGENSFVFGLSLGDVGVNVYEKSVG